MVREGGRYGEHEGEKGAGGGWQKVTHKKNRSFSSAPGGKNRGRDVVRGKADRKLLPKDAVTFFFTEFPDNFGAYEMWSVFEKFGMVYEVVIPNKKDKRGKRFGFVRFHEVRDPQRFAIRLDNIIIGRQKIFVNLPRFQEERGNEVRNNAPRPLHKSQYVQRQKTGPTNGGISYAQALGNTGDPSLKGKKKGVSPGQFEFAHLEFKVDEGVVQKLNNAYVGKVSKSGTTYCTQEELTRRGILEIKATPMGANLVLMEETVEGALSDLLSEVWVSEWFEEIRSWSAREIDNERVVWLRCYGVPAHAWSVDFFSFLVTGMGDFICVDENTLQKKSMDVARLLYKTRVHDLVSKLIKVDIGGDVFSIKMIEEWYGPMQWSMSKKLDDEMSSGSNSEEEEEDEEWHKSREDNEGTFSVEDSLSDQSINEQPLQNTVSETRDIEGSVNNLEDEMIQDILQRNVAGSINGGLDNFSASIKASL